MKLSLLHRRYFTSTPYSCDFPAIPVQLRLSKSCYVRQHHFSMSHCMLRIANQQAQDFTHMVCHSCIMYRLHNKCDGTQMPLQCSLLWYITYLSSMMNANAVSVVCRDRRKRKKHRLLRKRGMSRPNEEPSWRLALQR